ncbi:MAG TPA: hypothetical protein VGD58_25830 [Herpetosiphonaceae bacterium]
MNNITIEEFAAWGQAPVLHRRALPAPTITAIATAITITGTAMRIITAAARAP